MPREACFAKSKASRIGSGPPATLSRRVSPGVFLESVDGPRQEFHRNEAAQTQIAGFVHNSHATLPQLLGDFVMGDSVPDHDLGRRRRSDPATRLTYACEYGQWDGRAFRSPPAAGIAFGVSVLTSLRNEPPWL